MLAKLLARFTVATRRGFVALDNASEISKSIKDGEGCAWLRDGVDLTEARACAQNMSKLTGHNWQVLDPVPATGLKRAMSARIQVVPDFTGLEF